MSAPNDEFSLERAKAINAYADLERYLALLFSHLLATDMQKSYVIFSKITNARTRREILMRLISIDLGTKYSEFVKTFMKELRDVDETRNKVVHWIIMETAVSTDDPNYEIALHRHPDMFSDDRMYLDGVIAFRRKTRFLATLSYYFYLHLEHDDLPTPPHGQTTWREIFQQPVSYPPPKGHPLHRTDKEL